MANILILACAAIGRYLPLRIASIFPCRIPPTILLRVAAITRALCIAAGGYFALIDSARAQQDPASLCTAGMLESRDDSISIGSSISYGDSLQEVALYRLVTGIDKTSLEGEFLMLTSIGRWGILAPPAT